MNIALRPTGKQGTGFIVVRKLGLQQEGLHRRFLFIDGAWRDHLCFALLREDAPSGVLRRYLADRP